jgi:hypothetical protein
MESLLVIIYFFEYIPDEISGGTLELFLGHYIYNLTIRWR